MNQREFQALGATELDPMAVVLYVRTFRRYMNFATGEVALSLSRLQQELEYSPTSRSQRGKLDKPSTKRVRTLINALAQAGLLVLKSAGNAAQNRPAVYVCALATTDNSRQQKATLGHVRPNKRGHIQDTGTGHESGHIESPVNSGLEEDRGHVSGHRENCERGHISEISEIHTLSNARAESLRAEEAEPQPSSTGERLQFTRQFLVMARTCGMESRDFTDEDIQNTFDIFRTYKDNAHTQRALSTWLNLWRTWATREKARYAKRQRTYQPKPANGQPDRYRNAFEATADVFEQSRRYATQSPASDFSNADEPTGTGDESIPSRLRR